MNAYQIAVVREAVEEIAHANEKLNQQIRELQELCKESAEKLSQKEHNGVLLGEQIGKVVFG